MDRPSTSAAALAGILTMETFKQRIFFKVDPVGTVRIARKGPLERLESHTAGIEEPSPQQAINLIGERVDGSAGEFDVAHQPVAFDSDVRCPADWWRRGIVESQYDRIPLVIGQLPTAGRERITHSIDASVAKAHANCARCVLDRDRLADREPLHRALGAFPLAQRGAKLVGCHRHIRPPESGAGIRSRRRRAPNARRFVAARWRREQATGQRGQSLAQWTDRSDRVPGAAVPPAR